MVRLREIGRFGNSWAIKLAPADMKDLQLELGDLINIDDIIKIKKSKFLKGR